MDKERTDRKRYTQLEHYRRLAGLTQSDLATATGVSQPFISNLEARKNVNLDVEHIAMFCLEVASLLKTRYNIQVDSGDLLKVYGD
jgi:predicted transcriptional regulator